MDVEALKTAVCAEVDRLADQLLHASHEIHAHPELNFEEHFAHDLLVDQLRSAGLQHDARMPTASTPHSRPRSATAASTSPCSASTTRCRASATPAVTTSSPRPASAPAWPQRPSRRRPVARCASWARRPRKAAAARSTMARRGAFEQVDAAMMVHPADADLISMDCIALQELHVQFHGKAAHAAAAPWDGRNALDAAVLGYMNIAALRQHIRPTERIHGVFTKAATRPTSCPPRRRWSGSFVRRRSTRCNR